MVPTILHTQGSMDRFGAARKPRHSIGLKAFAPSLAFHTPMDRFTIEIDPKPATLTPFPLRVSKPAAACRLAVAAIRRPEDPERERASESARRRRRRLDVSTAKIERASGGAGAFDVCTGDAPPFFSWSDARGRAWGVMEGDRQWLGRGVSKSAAGEGSGCNCDLGRRRCASWRRRWRLWGHFVLGSKHSFRRRGGAVEPQGRGRGKGRPPIDGSIDRVVDGWIGAVVRVC